MLDGTNLPILDYCGLKHTKMAHNNFLSSSMSKLGLHMTSIILYIFHGSKGKGKFCGYFGTFEWRIYIVRLWTHAPTSPPGYAAAFDIVCDP